MKTTPTILIIALVRRVLAAGCSFALSLGLIEKAAREEIAERNLAATEADEIDALYLGLRSKLERALANDPPALRREILAKVDESHRREHALALSLRVQLPLALA